MRRRLGLQILSVFAAVALSSAVAVAAEEPTRGDGHRWSSRLQQKLGLTDDQTRAIGEIYARNARGWKEIGQSIRQARADLRRLVLEVADEGAIQAKQAELQALVADAVQRRTSTLKEIVLLLTPEQRAEYAQLLDHFAGHLRHHRKRS